MVLYVLKICKSSEQLMQQIIYYLLKRNKVIEVQSTYILTQYSVISNMQKNKDIQLIISL